MVSFCLPGVTKGWLDGNPYPPSSAPLCDCWLFLPGDVALSEDPVDLNAQEPLQESSPKRSRAEACEGGLSIDPAF